LRSIYYYTLYSDATISPDGEPVFKLPKKIVDCFFLLRIPLLAPVWTIFILGWITGTEKLQPGGCLTTCSLSGVHFSQLWILLIGFSLIVASIYVVNQIVDIESDRINHKLFLLPHRIISVRTAWVLALSCASTGFVIAAIHDTVFVALFSASLLLGFAYNLPPFSLKNHAWGGVIANAAGHGFLTFIAGWYCSKYPGQLSWPLLQQGLVSSLSPSLANAAVFLVTTIPDAAGDKRTGKQTFAVRFGSSKTAIAAAVMCGAATVSSLFMENHFWVMLVPSVLSLLFFVYFAVSLKTKIAFKAFKWPVFLLSVAVTLYVPEYGALILITFFGSKFYYKWRFGIEYPTFKSK